MIIIECRRFIYECQKLLLRFGVNRVYFLISQFLVKIKKVVNLEKKINVVVEFLKMYFSNDWEDLLRFIFI